MLRQALEGEGAMNYDVYAGSAAYALPEALAQFIRRTYAHLALAMLGFLVIEYALLQVPGIERIGALMTEGFNWLIVLALFIGVSWIADYWAKSDTSRGLQYAGLTLYVVAQAIIFLPLMVLAVLISNDPTVVPAAGLITLLLFAGLTVVVFTTRVDFSFLRTILIIGGVLGLGVFVGGIVFWVLLGVVFSGGLVGVA